MNRIDTKKEQETCWILFRVFSTSEAKKQNPEGWVSDEENFS